MPTQPDVAVGKGEYSAHGAETNLQCAGNDADLDKAPRFDAGYNR